MDYLSIYDELVYNGYFPNEPYQMLQILASIPRNNDWENVGKGLVNFRDGNFVSNEEIINNKIGLFNNLLSKIQKINILEIKTDSKKIEEEIKLFCKGHIKILAIEIIIEMGHKRKSCICIEMKNDNIYIFKIHYNECDGNANKEELKFLLDEIMILINGISGTVGVEFDLLDQIDVNKIYDCINMGNCQYIKWNNNVQM